MPKTSQIRQIVGMAMRQAQAAADRERIGIAVRTMMIFCYAMLQCEIDPETVKHVRDVADNLVSDKFDGLKDDGVAEAWIRKQLEADGIIFQELPPEVSFDF